MSFFDLTTPRPWRQKIKDCSNALIEKEENFTVVEQETEGEKPTINSSEVFLGIVISNLLKYGVFLASAVVFMGGFFYLKIYGSEPVNYHLFQGEPKDLCSPVGVIKMALLGNPLGIIQLGLLLLVATPVIRVAFSLLVFLWKRDILYIIVTLLVLSGLIFSFLGAYF